MCINWYDGKDKMQKIKNFQRRGKFSSIYIQGEEVIFSFYGDLYECDWIDYCIINRFLYKIW